MTFKQLLFAYGCILSGSSFNDFLCEKRDKNEKISKFLYDEKALCSFCSFDAAKLSGANFSDGGRYLHSIFSGTDLSGANLSNSFFTYAKFIGTDDKPVDLRGADLTGANFCHATFDNVDMKDIILTETTIFDFATFRNIKNLDMQNFIKNEIRMVDITTDEDFQAALSDSIKPPPQSMFEPVFKFLGM